MPNTVQRYYRGWDVTIRCMHHGGQGSLTAPRRYTAAAHAELQSPDVLALDWIDSRPQSVTLGERSFTSGEDCVETLWAEVKLLIDALAKSNHAPLAPS